MGTCTDLGSVGVVFLVTLLAANGAQPASVRKVVHVFVALADNASQGIVPVPSKLGNGDDPGNNLYWGAAYGVKAFLQRQREWSTIAVTQVALPSGVLERAVFQHRRHDAYIVADAYRGAAIKTAIMDFLTAAGGGHAASVQVAADQRSVVDAGGAADLVAYIGHDGLMDFVLDELPARVDHRARDIVVLACISKRFFAEPVRATGGTPLLWTTGLMAPEAYTLAAAIDGWLVGESPRQIHERAALAYDRYQKCGAKAARRLFATGW